MERKISSHFYVFAIISYLFIAGACKRGVSESAGVDYIPKAPCYSDSAMWVADINDISGTGNNFYSPFYRHITLNVWMSRMLLTIFSSITTMAGLLFLQGSARVEEQ